MVIELSETTEVAELARVTDIPAMRLVGAAFHSLGLLLTIHEELSFDQAKDLVAEFGHLAVRKVS